jgi:hypothetical protein
MAETLALLVRGSAPTTRQDTTVGETLRVIPPEYLAVAKANLAQGRYSHFVQ